jgi:predicted metal-binding membrane protein
VIALAHRVEAWREARWAHPEWWILAVGLVAWIRVAEHGFDGSLGAHAHRASAGIELAYWTAMALAMMLPVIALQARAVAFRALAERRHRAVLAFLIGFLASWTAAGLLPSWLALLPWSHSRAVVAGAFAIATAWALLPLRGRAMMMAFGYAPLLAPTGWDADRDAAWSGLIVGAWCVASCWPLMLACALSGHHLLALLVGGSIAIVEMVSFRPPRLFVTLASGALTAFFWYSSQFA